MSLSYAVRPADPFFRREHPDATELVLMQYGYALRVLAVYRTLEIADQMADNLNAHTEFQIR